MTTSKPPIKSPSSSSTLKKEDIEKLFRELIQKEFARLGIYLEESVQDVPSVSGERIAEISEDDFMDIDLVRLENAKDLLAMNGRLSQSMNSNLGRKLSQSINSNLEGEVEGIEIQVLADTCANLSWIPKFLAEELEMEIDTSKTYKVNGVSGEERSLGMVRDGLIELASGCVVKEDLAVVNYKHREIGLSRPCLRHYNYDVHESREHIALTCEGKNFFIPIVPDINRSTEEKEEN